MPANHSRVRLPLLGLAAGLALGPRRRDKRGRERKRKSDFFFLSPDDCINKLNGSASV